MFGWEDIIFTLYLSITKINLAKTKTKNVLSLEMTVYERLGEHSSPCDLKGLKKTYAVGIFYIQPLKGGVLKVVSHLS